ncbi:MAG: metal-dependent transcriptional regulator [candidate division Zixibacteria bacterium]|nr:metal-dependent transcriptional regulator [candidate division Zixibacteria bacterium]
MASEALSASLEDYLEVILHLITEKRVARARDISRRLGVNMSSVTGALHALADRKMVNYAPYEVVTLTSKGKQIARDVVRRHEALRDFLVQVLLVDKELAESTACKMEHVIGHEILERFIRFMDFLDSCPYGHAEWLNGFGYYCKGLEGSPQCESCAARLIEKKPQKRKS